MGLFSDMFDFDGDGELDTFEKAARFATLASLGDTLESEMEAAERTDLDSDDDE